MIPNPWVILGAILVAVSVYFYGHHKGWDERDAADGAQRESVPVWVRMRPTLPHEEDEVSYVWIASSRF